MEKIGIVDVGSNTARMVVMQYVPHHSFKLIDEVKETVRLAQDMGQTNMLQPEPIERAIETLKMFSELGRALSLDKLLVVTTSAVRDAANQMAFLAQVKDQTGLDVRVLSGEEEAYYGYLGAINSVAFQNGFVFDIGGGSIEVALIRGRGLVQQVSLPLGTIRMAERFLVSDPPTKQEIKQFEQFLDAELNRIPWLSSAQSLKLNLVGIGGIVRTLAKIDQAELKYPIDRLHHYAIPAERIAALSVRLSKLTRKERENIRGLSSDRADLIVAGVIMVCKLLQYTRAEALVVSGQGLREGLFYEQFLVGSTPPLLPHVRTFAVENLARNAGYHMVHAQKVRSLSLALFDQLQSLHGYGSWERELLAAGAILHDIGVSINYYDHHKHSLYLLMNSMLGGFSHRELAIIALLARNHRKGSLYLGELEPLLMQDDPERVAKLSALLRIAEYLERSKSQVVQHIECWIEKEQVRIHVHALGDATVEIWDANRRSTLFRKAYGMPVLIQAALIQE